MSSNTISNTCANCGKEGTDVTNTCNKCKEVMYCNAACKKKHRKKHKKECEKRLAELHDQKLFKQPPPLDDCSICFLRMPCVTQFQVYMSCCGKLLCRGCIHAVALRDGGVSLCPFCRTPAPTSDEEFVEGYMKRMELNDPLAIHNVGSYYDQGKNGFTQNYEKALELWHQAGKLGYSEAYYNIGNAHRNGNGVERDNKRAKHYYELSAMQGDVLARHNLGVQEYKEAGNKDRALKHFMIAAGGGNKDSLENVRRIYKAGHATKDDYNNALRAYQEYVGEIKSKQRDEAAAYDPDWRYY